MFPCSLASPFRVSAAQRKGLGHGWFLGGLSGSGFFDNPLVLQFGNYGLLGVSLENATFGLPGSTSIDATFTLLRADGGNSFRPVFPNHRPQRYLVLVRSRSRCFGVAASAADLQKPTSSLKGPRSHPTDPSKVYRAYPPRRLTLRAHRHDDRLGSAHGTAIQASTINRPLASRASSMGSDFISHASNMCA